MRLTTHVRTHFRWVKATEDMGSEVAYNEGYDPDTWVYTVYATVRMGKPVCSGESLIFYTKAIMAK